MTAKLCNGTPTDQPTVRESNAYCEGREAAAAGAADTTNPHPSGSRDEAMWDAGYATWDTDPAAAGGMADCCASAYGGGFSG